jgi:hypothetical protein
MPRIASLTLMCASNQEMYVMYIPTPIIDYRTLKNYLLHLYLLVFRNPLGLWWYQNHYQEQRKPLSMASAAVISKGVKIPS